MGVHAVSWRCWPLLLVGWVVCPRKMVKVWIPLNFLCTQFLSFCAGSFQVDTTASLVSADASNDAQAKSIFDRRACSNQRSHNTMLVIAWLRVLNQCVDQASRNFSLATRITDQFTVSRCYSMSCKAFASNLTPQIDIALLAVVQLFAIKYQTSVWTRQPQHSAVVLPVGRASMGGSMMSSCKSLLTPCVSWWLPCYKSMRHDRMHKRFCWIVLSSIAKRRWIAMLQNCCHHSQANQPKTS